MGLPKSKEYYGTKADFEKTHPEDKKWKDASTKAGLGQKSQARKTTKLTTSRFKGPWYVKCLKKTVKRRSQVKICKPNRTVSSVQLHIARNSKEKEVISERKQNSYRWDEPPAYVWIEFYSGPGCVNSTLWLKSWSGLLISTLSSRFVNRSPSNPRRGCDHRWVSLLIRWHPQGSLHTCIMVHGSQTPRVLERCHRSQSGLAGLARNHQMHESAPNRPNLINKNQKSLLKSEIFRTFRKSSLCYVCYE